MTDILKVRSAKVVGPHSLFVTFNDGVPLLDPGYFARMTLDPAFGVPTWPNDADLAPEALHALPDERGDAA